MQGIKWKSVGIALVVFMLTACRDDSASSDPSGPGTDPMTESTGCLTALELDVEAYKVGGTIEAGSCHLVNRNLLVNGGLLTIEAGATLKFNADISLIIAEDGRLTLSGTAEAPVRLVGQEESVGFWRGLNVSSSGAANVLDHFVIAHAGSRGWNGGDYSTGSIFADTSSGATLTNCEIAEGGGHGFVALEQSELSISECVIRDHVQGGYVHADAAGNIAADNEFVDNATNVVRVGFSSADILQAETWQNIGVPWRVETRLNVRAPLTIAPGAVVEFDQDIGAVVAAEGRLTLQGDAEAPITLTGVEKTRGYWQGVRVETRGSENTFDHVVFEFAGSRDWNGAEDSSAALRFEDGSSMSITNTTFREHGNYAVWAGDAVVFPSFEDNTFADNAKVAFLRPNVVRQISPNNTFTENDENVVRISAASGNFLTQSSTWLALPVPYVVTDQTQINSSLTIEEGTRIEFLQDASLNVEGEGSLTALGTAEAPIVFTSREGEENAGFWKGVKIATTSASNQLDYVTIQYAGSTGWYGGDDTNGALLVGGGSVAITNSVIADVTGWGIDLRSDGSVISCEGTTFSNLTSANVKGSPAGVCM